MKRCLMAVVLAFLLLCGCLSTASVSVGGAAPASYVPALPMTSRVLVDGEPVDLQAYNIQGNNYFKLRDLGAALNGTEKQFDILWDGAESTIRILTRQPYTAAADAGSAPSEASPEEAVLSNATLFVDGMPAAVTAYNIDGLNYFKLRDLGTALGFEVSWDAEAGRILIGTTGTEHETSAEMQFGAAAYQYVEYIQNHLPSRIAGTQREKDAGDYILSELEKDGYAPDQLEVQSFEFQEDGQTLQSRNIIADKKGQSEKLIIVGAHYDSIGNHGVEDNGSGLSVVLEMAARLVNQQVPYSIRFIFFGAEEGRPLAKGAAYYVSTLSEAEKQNILQMVNLDSIMSGDKEYIFGGRYRSNGTVTELWAAEHVKQIADGLGLDMLLVPAMDANLDSPSDRSDHIYFMAEDIPYVFFWAGNLELLPISELRQTEKLGKILHTPYDDLKLINENFPGRARERLANYSALLYHVLTNTEEYSG